MVIKIDFTRTAVSIKSYQKKWLESHREINFSGFVQTKLDELIDNFKQINKNNEKKE